MTDLKSQFQRFCDLQNRRQFITRAGIGLGAAAAGNVAQAAAPTEQAGVHHQPKAKRVIFLFMAGAPSQLDLFDYKPHLDALHGQPLPKEISKGQRVTAMTRDQEQVVCASIFKFARTGQSGLYWSELLPHLSQRVDDLCLIKSTHTEAINHDPAKTFFCTGAERPGQPSMGSWLSYGLGTTNKNLPDFIVMTSAFWSGKVGVQGLYSRLWGSGFLPSKHQGCSVSVGRRSGSFSLQSAWCRSQDPRQDARVCCQCESATTAIDKRSRDSNFHFPAGNGVPNANVSPRAD